MLKKEKDHSLFWTIVILIVLVVFIKSCNDEMNKQDQETQTNVKIQITQTEPVFFCNNTKLLMTDQYGEGIQGEVYYSQGSDNFWNKGFPEKIQKGITYNFWIDSPTHFVKPVEFKPDCKNEEDTKIQYLSFDAKERSNATHDPVLTAFDEKTYDNIGRHGLTINNRTQTVDKETFETITTEENNYLGVLNLQLTQYYKKSFLPFGGVMVVEATKEINVDCLEVQQVQTPFSYPNLIGITRTYKIPELPYWNDAFQVRCFFELSNADNLDKINNSTFKITIYQNDYYINKKKELVLDTTKEGDEVFEFVNNYNISTEGVIKID